MHGKLFLIRHGETPWALSGQHTGRTNIPLTEKGISQAKNLLPRLKEISFSHVYCSPLSRAYDTCKYAGLLEQAEIADEIQEWDYGKYEGLTSEEIHKDNPNWNIFTHGAPGGESITEMQTRVDRFLKKIAPLSGPIAIFSHGHCLRVLAMRWLGLPLASASHFSLSPASLSILGYEHEIPAIKLWNS